MIRHLIAQSIQINGKNSAYNITGPLVSFNTIGDLVNSIVNILMPVAFLILLGVFISGGYDLLMSQGGDKMKTGRAKLTAGVIGIIIMATAYLLVKVLGQLFNLNSYML